MQRWGSRSARRADRTRTVIGAEFAAPARIKLGRLQLAMEDYSNAEDSSFLGTLAAPFVWVGTGVKNAVVAVGNGINDVADAIGGTADTTGIAPVATSYGGRRRRRGGKKGKTTLKKRRGGRKTRAVRRH